MDRLTDEEKKQALDWAKKNVPHLIENTEMVYMLWRKATKKERITDQPTGGGFSYIQGTKHKTPYVGIVTVVELIRPQKEWRRCKACFRKDVNCTCKTDKEKREYDMVQNYVYLVGDNTTTIQAERYVINGDKSHILQEGATYWVRYKKEYSNYWNCDVLTLTGVEELEPEKAKAYIDFWDTFYTVHSCQMPNGAFQTFCTKKKMQADDIIGRFTLEVLNETLVRRE